MEQNKKHLRAMTKANRLPAKAQFISPIQAKKEFFLALLQLFINERQRP